jgi:hypothetical protein
MTDSTCRPRPPFTPEVAGPRPVGTKGAIDPVTLSQVDSR